MQFEVYNGWYDESKDFYDVLEIRVFGVTLIGCCIDIESYFTIGLCFMNITLQIDFD